MDSGLKQEARGRFAKDIFAMARVLFPKAILKQYGNPWYARYMIWCFGQFQKTIVKLPRLHGKSTYVTFLYVMWTILTRRKKFILIVSSTGAQAVKFLARVKHYLKSRKVKQYYGDLDSAITEDGEIRGYIQSDGKKKTPVWNFKEIYIEAWGIRVMATSIKTANRGLLSIDDRPDMIILDDVEDKKNTNTLALRESLLDTIYEELVPAGTKDCQFIMVGTICHYGSYLLKVEKSDVYHAIPIDRATMSIEDFELINKKLPEEFRYYPKQEYFTRDIKGLDGKYYRKGDPTPEVATWQPHYSYEYFCLKYQEYKDVGKPLSFWQEFYNTPKDKSTRLFTEFKYVKGISFQRYRKENVLVSSGDFTFPNGKKMINVNTFQGGDLAVSDSENADNRCFITIATDPYKNIYVFKPDINKEPNPFVLGTRVLEDHNKYDYYSATYDGQNFQKWFGSLLKHILTISVDRKGNKIFKKLKVHQEARAEKKEDVISSVLSRHFDRMYFLGERSDFMLLENELRKLGYFDSDDCADALTYACMNIKYPSEIDFNDVSVSPVISMSVSNDPIDEYSDEEAWFYA